MQGVRTSWPILPLEGSAAVVQLLVRTSPQKDFSCSLWSRGLLEFSHLLVYCSTLVSRAAMWYFIHSDMYVPYVPGRC